MIKPPNLGAITSLPDKTIFGEHLPYKTQGSFISQEGIELGAQSFSKFLDKEKSGEQEAGTIAQKREAKVAEKISV